MSVTTSNSVWQQFRQLSEIARDTDIEIVLRRLVEWFEADGIGLTRHDAVEPELSFFPMRPVPHVFPWQTDVGVRKQLEASSSAETFHNSVGEWLIAPVLEPGRATTSWAWLYRLNGRNWNEAEPWLWQYASRFLIPRQKPTIDSPTSAEWKQRLDLAALVTGRLSHDFGNYLTGIMGFTELSLMHVDADSAPHRFMQEVLEAARNGADWLRRLHHFCRRGPMGGWPTVISSVLAAEEARLRSTGMAGMRWLTEVPADLSLVAMDALSLQTALAELANNACEATKFEGTIRIKAGVIELTQAECRALLGSAAPGRFVRLSVADDGPGFTPQHRERLSRELFFSTKPKQRGLGLPVVYGILQRCAGALRIGAPTEGAGARVELYLPVADIAPVTPRPDAPPVLVVQSDPHLLESMRRVLELGGYRVTGAGSVLAALDAYAAARQAFALVIAEVEAPHLAGLELARRILGYDPRANFLFLLTSASFHAVTDEELLKRFPSLAWPAEPGALLNAAETALTPIEKN